MDIIFDIILKNKENDKRFGSYRKEFQSQVIPNPGISIEDPSWSADPKIPSEIILSYDENYCLVNFDGIERDNEDYCKKLEEYMLEHGWNKL